MLYIVRPCGICRFSHSFLFSKISPLQDDPYTAVRRSASSSPTHGMSSRRWSRFRIHDPHPNLAVVLCMKLVQRLLRICPSAHSVPELRRLLEFLLPRQPEAPSSHPGRFSILSLRPANHACRPRQLSDFAKWRGQIGQGPLAMHNTAKRARGAGSTQREHGLGDP